MYLLIKKRKLNGVYTIYIVKEVSEEVFILNEDGTYSFWNWTPEEKEKVARDLDIQFARQEAEAKCKKAVAKEVAKEMLKNNEPLEKIMKYTNLSMGQIKYLKYHFHLPSYLMLLIFEHLI